jgi:hypothetical protein
LTLSLSLPLRLRFSSQHQASHGLKNKMELPSPPSPVHLPTTSTTTSPVVSRPPSPISASRSSSAAPSAFQQHQGEGENSAYSTRNSSRSKDPLFKREGRAARGGAASGWAEKVKGLLSGGTGKGIQERGRRPSAAQVERGSRPTASSLAEAPKKRWQVSEEKLQLAVSFGMIGLVGMNVCNLFSIYRRAYS